MNREFLHEITFFSGELSEDTKKLDSTKSKKSSKKPTTKAVISEKPDLTLDESSQGEFQKVQKVHYAPETFKM